VAKSEFDALLDSTAKEIIQQAIKDEVKVIGVVKFLVDDGVEPSLSVGNTNLALSRYFRNALAENLKGDDPPIQLVLDADFALQRTLGADHSTDPGRKKLFRLKSGRRAKFPVGDGRYSEPVDRFICGYAEVLEEDALVNIRFQCFDEGTGIKNLGAMHQGVPLPPEVLADFGKNYEAPRYLELHPNRGGENLGVGEPADLQDEAPFQFHVFYDDAPIKVVGREANDVLRLPEPQDGQKVEFMIRRTDDEPIRMGVVVKVNGESTLCSQTRPSTYCAKWILGPQDSVWIRGFQTIGEDGKPGETYKKFRVLSEDASRNLVYSSNTGLITVECFLEKKEAKSRESRVGPRALATTEMVRAADFRDEFRLSGLRSRGVLKGAEEIERRLKIEKVNFEQTPVLTQVLRYYDP
ncbi:MAG: hypothetical protein KDA37_12675, partial [Planctomycetales bacterium]|nr:hypothetical protein [Planctomycetales bacterium]